MAQAALLIDSDVFLVLAGAGVLDQVITLLGCARDRTLRLGPLPQMIGEVRHCRLATLQTSGDARRSRAHRLKE